MKSKWHLACSIFQLVVGAVAVAVFLILALNGEVVTKWIITLILAIIYVVFGIIGIVDYLKKGK